MNFDEALNGAFEQARKKLFEKGGADFAPGPYAVFFFFTGPPPASKIAQVLKKLMSGGGGGGTPILVSLGQFSRHGVGFHFQKRGAIAPPPPPPPSDGHVLRCNF